MTVKEEANDSVAKETTSDLKSVLDLDDERHLIGESEEGKPECSLCRATFSRKCHALRHIKTVHSRTAQKVACYVCGSQHKNKEARDVHVRQIHNIYQARWGEGQLEDGDDASGGPLLSMGQQPT